ncbi:hypothetical protein Amet_1188 [Alkaliphilus metalliredigens QYMF]|uniref:Uncharacterized protein n=1 Tax=Alkaliphilus metalliredigens (strain QYMF) TaxID=293826 RepID=A6TMH8_ALKMQ|nr:hypothetical protein Amet_1188 [Alkaliphilus metalliredigens QYMF]
MLSLVLIVLMLGVPIVITVLVIRHFGKKESHNELVLNKIIELEKRIEELESGGD